MSYVLECLARGERLLSAAYHEVEELRAALRWYVRYHEDAGPVVTYEEYMSRARNALGNEPRTITLGPEFFDQPIGCNDPAIGFLSRPEE